MRQNEENNNTTPMVQAQLAKAAPVKANARELSSQRKHMHTHAHTKKNSLTNGVTVKIKMYNVSFFFCSLYNVVSKRQKHFSPPVLQKPKKRACPSVQCVLVGV